MFTLPVCEGNDGLFQEGQRFVDVHGFLLGLSFRLLNVLGKERVESIMGGSNSEHLTTEITQKHLEHVIIPPAVNSKRNVRKRKDRQHSNCNLVSKMTGRARLI